MLRKITILVFSALLLISFGCNEISNDEFSVIGTYHADYYQKTDLLIIHENGSYYHEFNFNGKNQRNIGKWSLTTNDSKIRMIIFDDFIFREHKGGIKPPGVWLVESEKTIGNTVELCFDDDLDLCFISK